jgi:hypothetical protein
MNRVSKPRETGKKGDDLPLPAHARFLIDALELVARRVDADAKADIDFAIAAFTDAGKALGIV